MSYWKFSKGMKNITQPAYIWNKTIDREIKRIEETLTLNNKRN